MAGCKTDFVCTLSIKFKSVFLHAQWTVNFFTITSLYSVIFGNIFEWTKIKKTDELVEILFRNYLACEFTAHYACRNAEMNMKSATYAYQQIQLSSNKFINRTLVGMLDLAWIKLPSFEPQINVLLPNCRSPINWYWLQGATSNQAQQYRRKTNSGARSRKKWTHPSAKLHIKLNKKEREKEIRTSCSAVMMASLDASMSVCLYRSSTGICLEVWRTD